MTSERMDPAALLAALQGNRDTPASVEVSPEAVVGRPSAEPLQFVFTVAEDPLDGACDVTDSMQPVETAPSTSNDQLSRGRFVTHYDPATNTCYEVPATGKPIPEEPGNGLADELFEDSPQPQAAQTDADQEPRSTHERKGKWRRVAVIGALGAAAYGGILAATGPLNIPFHAAHSQARNGDVSIIDSMRGQAEADEQLRREFLDLPMGERALVAVKEAAGDLGDIWRLFR